MPLSFSQALSSPLFPPLLSPLVIFPQFAALTSGCPMGELQTTASDIKSHSPLHRSVSAPMKLTPRWDSGPVCGGRFCQCVPHWPEFGTCFYNALLSHLPLFPLAKMTLYHVTHKPLYFPVNHRERGRIQGKWRKERQLKADRVRQWHIQYSREEMEQTVAYG